MPGECQTDAALLQQLRAAAKREMTQDEVRQQRVSFVYGNLPENATLTKLQVEAALARVDGEVVAA